MKLHLLIPLALVTLAAISFAQTPQLNSSLPRQFNDDPVAFLQANINLSCDVCKYVVYEVAQFLIQQEPMIEKKLVRLCSYLPLQFEQIVS